jgi:hypothetical protein
VDSGTASAIIASTVAITLVRSIRRDERVIALPLCPTFNRYLLTDSWREAGRGSEGYPNVYSTADFSKSLSSNILITI